MDWPVTYEHPIRSCDSDARGFVCNANLSTNREETGTDRLIEVVSRLPGGRS